MEKPLRRFCARVLTHPKGHPKVKTGEVRLVGKATGKIVIGSGWAAPGSIWQAVAEMSHDGRGASC